MTFNLHRTNINLYEDDVEYLRRIFGTGWTTKVRDIVHNYVRDRKPKPTDIQQEIDLIAEDSTREQFE